jgi:hypothetical protein
LEGGGGGKRTGVVGGSAAEDLEKHLEVLVLFLQQHGEDLDAEFQRVFDSSSLETTKFGGARVTVRIEQRGRRRDSLLVE